MFKKTLISLAVASSLGLTGCFDSGGKGGNANPEYQISNPDIDGKTWPVFNPVTGDVPLPNDLIFQSDDTDTVGINEADGTFNIDSPENPVISALNRLSGASTVAPVDIAMSGEIDANSVDAQPFVVDADGELVLENGLPIPNPNQNVFLLELDYASGEPVQALSLSEPPTVPLAQPFSQIKQTVAAGGTPSAQLVGAANAAARAAVDQYEVDVIKQTTDDGSVRSVIRLNFLKPLNPGKRYLAVVTDSVKDSSNNNIIQSPVYTSLTDENAPIGNATLKPAATIVNKLWETVAGSYFALPNGSRESADLPPLSDADIAVSFSFTTSSDEKVLRYMAQPGDWFTDQLRSLVRLGTVRKMAGAATVLGAVAEGSSLEDALKAKRKSKDEVGPNDTNGNGAIDPLDFDFNGDGDLTTADFNLSTTGDTAASSFNYFDIQAGLAAAEAQFPPAALKLALPTIFGDSGACSAAPDFETATSCGGIALATSPQAFGSLVPKIGDKSDTISLTPFSSPESTALPAALITPAVTSVTGSDTALVMQGSIELPYYLGKPNGADGSPINDEIWKPDHSFAEALNGEFGKVGLQLAQGVKDKDGDYVSDAVNYLYPFPALTDNVEVPMLVMVPRPGQTTAGGVTWDGASKLPVVIFQHGITTDRSAALSVGSSLTAAGYGVVAIDLPLHGVDAQDQSDKTSGVAEEKQALAATLLKGLDAKDADSGDLLPEQNTAANVTAIIEKTYIAEAVTYVATNFGCSETNPKEIAAGNGNCASAQATAGAAQYVGFAIGAENAVANHTSVIPGIARTGSERHFNFTQGAAGNPTAMNFEAGVGSSGSLYINLRNFFNTRDKNLQSQIDLVNLIASVGGIDVNGDGQGDFDTTNINLVGHSLGTVAGAGAVAVANQTDTINDVQATVLLTPAAGIVRMLENSPSFAPTILGGLQALEPPIEQGTSTYETFMRVVQHSIDPVDPINLADNLVAGGSIMTINVVGTEDGNGNTKYPSDQTTIIEAGNTQLNNAFPSFLAGGIPLAEELNATNVAATDGSQTSLVANLAYGTHSMFVLPKEDQDIENKADRLAEFARQQDAFAEGLSLTSEFLLNGGVLSGAVDATTGTVGGDIVTPILDDRATPTAKDEIDSDDSDEFKQLNPIN